MELAHLYLIHRELRKKSLKSIYDDAIYLIPSFLYTGYRILIIGNTFMLDKGQIQYLSCLTIKSCKNTIVTSPVGRIKMNKSMAAKRRLLPFYYYIA